MQCLRSGCRSGSAGFEPKLEEPPKGDVEILNAQSCVFEQLPSRIFLDKLVGLAVFRTQRNSFGCFQSGAVLCSTVRSNRIQQCWREHGVNKFCHQPRIFCVRADSTVFQTLRICTNRKNSLS